VTGQSHSQKNSCAPWGFTVFNTCIEGLKLRGSGSKCPVNQRSGFPKFKVLSGFRGLILKPSSYTQPYEHSNQERE
jgi:hypothetical protein